MVTNSPFTIRQARLEDVDVILTFATDTFAWGDYVPDFINDWIVDDGVVHVACIDDVPIGMMRLSFLSESELWSQAARVHPDHRGRRIASALQDAQVAWARERGGLIIRMQVEDDNEPSIAHAMRYGFKRAASVVRAVRAVGAASPNPSGNGGRRHPSLLVAKPGKRQDVPLVRSSWETSEVARHLRQLAPIGWQFRRLSDTDIEQAASTGNLWEVGSSWVITGAVEPVCEVRLMDTTPGEAYDVCKALVDLANNRGAELLTMWIPDLDWSVQAARRVGCDTEGYGVWELPL